MFIYLNEKATFSIADINTHTAYIQLIPAFAKNCWLRYCELINAYSSVQQWWQVVTVEVDEKIAVCRRRKKSAQSR